MNNTVLKIAVCFKTIADYQRLSANNWKWNDSLEVDTGFIRQIFNCFDETALEMALGLSDMIKKESAARPNLTAITIDDRRSEIFLRHLAAVGYDELVRIECQKEIDLRFNPLAVSRLLAACVKRDRHDLVLFGTQGADGDNRQTGPLTAEQLHWPCIRDVERIEGQNGGATLKVTSRIEGGTLVQTVRPPVVLVVGQSPETPYLRFANLKQKMSAKKKRITLLSPADLGIDELTLSSNDKTLIGFTSRKFDRTCRFLEASDPEGQARHLFKHHIQKRLSS